MALNVQAKDTATNTVGLSDLNLKADTSSLPKVYAAIMSQSDTDAPTVTVAANALSGAVVWTRSNAGEYVGTLAGAFPLAKTTYNPVVFINTGENLFVTLQRLDDDSVMITAVANGVGEDGWLSNAPVQILVYP